MARWQIDFPGEAIFSTDIAIHGIYINRGNHVGNSAYVELCNETAQRFFVQKQVPEYTVGKEVLLNTGFAVQLKSEANYGDVLSAEMAVDNFHAKGCDFVYRFSQAENKTVVAIARFSYLAFDFERGVVVPVAESFRGFFEQSRAMPYAIKEDAK